MLQYPNSCTHNNIHVLRHERNTPTGQHRHTQHRRQHHMLGNGGGAGQCELGIECDSQHATTKPPCALRRAQLKAWRCS